MRTLSRIAQLITDAACAILYAFSAGALLAIAASAWTQRLAPAGIAALTGIIITMSCFGYALWRKYHRRLHMFTH
jgi:Flp pilus assembly protein TadB